MAKEMPTRKKDRLRLIACDLQEQGHEGLTILLGRSDAPESVKRLRRMGRL